MSKHKSDLYKTEPIQFDESDDLPDIRYDNIFKAVFTKDTPASKGALSGLISDLIGRDVIALNIIANEPPIGNIFERCIRFDIACKAKNGELINIEMSFFPKYYEPVRMEYYVSRLFSGQEIKGTESNYSNLMETYQITIMGHELFFPDEVLVHTFLYYDPVHNIPLRGKCRIITVELSKIELIDYKPINLMESNELWSFFFQYLTNKEKREKINEIIRIKEEIAMAGETLIHISRSEIEHARQTSELKYILDRQSEMVTARREGRKEGLEEGRKEGIKEGIKEGKKEGINEGKAEGHENAMKTVARNALAKGFSVESIHEITGLDMETIKNLNQ